jgi:hypothetical protein
MAHRSSLPRSLPLWPLPLVAGLLPAVGVLVALLMFKSSDGSFCNPFIDDCVSISRMARQGMANHVFRALVLPGAVLQMLTWLAAAHAIAGARPERNDALPVALLGVCAAAMLVVYASFLGSDGATYRWLRRWGTLVYFGGTYLAMLFLARALLRLHRAHRLTLPRGHHRVLLGLLAFITILTLAHGFASLSGFNALEDRIENLTEWWGALALTLCFATLASLWSRWGMVVTIGVLRPSAAGEGARPLAPVPMNPAVPRQWQTLLTVQPPSPVPRPGHAGQHHEEHRAEDQPQRPEPRAPDEAAGGVTKPRSIPIDPPRKLPAVSNAD